MLRLVAEDSPLVRLTFAILLSAVRKNAAAVSLSRRGGEGVVWFVLDGQTVEEMAPPWQVLTGVVRRLSIMANLPVYGRDQEAEGELGLALDGRETSYFAIRVSGHGDSLGAVLRRIPGPRARPLTRSQYR